MGRGEGCKINHVGDVNQPPKWVEEESLNPTEVIWLQTEVERAVCEAQASTYIRDEIGV